MYPGINGSTHGDKKLINPAIKAIDNVVFIWKSLSIPIPACYRCQYFNILSWPHHGLDLYTVKEF